MTDRDGDAIEQCPYCPDGELEDIEGYDTIRYCSNGGSCPATFVVVLSPGGQSDDW